MGSLSDEIFVGTIPKKIVFKSKNGEKKIIEASEGGHKLLRVSKTRKFIKRLKEEIKHDIEQEDTWEGFEHSIDKIFGEKLI